MKWDDVGVPAAANMPLEDPRIGRTRAAVMRATVDLLAEGGAGAVTHQRVAALARVSRSTLYRYWPHSEDLLFEALAQIVTTFDFSGPGRLRDALATELKRRRADIGNPLVRTAFTTLMARALHDPAAATVRDRVIGTIADGLRQSVQRGIDRGELRPGLDPRRLTAKVLGALAWWSFVDERPVTADLVDEVVREALVAWEIPAGG